MPPATFIAPKLTYKNVDNYYIRAAIYNAIKENVKSFHGSFLDVGCGKMPYREFICSNSKVTNYTGLDIETAIDYGGPKPNVYWDGITMPFKKNSFDCAMATEVFEHCPDPALTMTEICKVLKPDGVLFFTVPFLWPLHEIPHDEFRYTPFSLKRLLQQSGFSDIEIKATGGWDASLAQMIGLWINRRGLPRFVRLFFALISMPLIKLLKNMDKKPGNLYESTSMITGMYGTAIKHD